MSLGLKQVCTQALHNKINFEQKPSRLFPNSRISRGLCYSSHASHLLSKNLGAEGEVQMRKVSRYFRMYSFQAQTEDIPTDNTRTFP